MSFPDAGPQPDGTRTARQWINAIMEDFVIILRNLEHSIDPSLSETKEETATYLALARKEGRRLLSDIRRFAKEVHDMSEEDLDNIGPL